MQTIGVILFVAVLLVFGVSIGKQFQGKGEEHNYNAVWVTIGIILVLGILAMLGKM